MSSKSPVHRSSPIKRKDNLPRRQAIQRQVLKGDATPDPIKMQKRLGNQGTQAWLVGQQIQTKLADGQRGGQYEQEADRVVQPSQEVQAQDAGNRQHFTPLITEETMNLGGNAPAAETLGLSTTNSPQANRMPSTSPENRRQLLVQAKLLSPLIQKADGGNEPPRKDLVFIMGRDSFYIAAKMFFKTHYPEAEIISLKDNSLGGIFAKLREVASKEHPVGNLYIVSHATTEGTLGFGLSKKDKDRKTSFGELKSALAKSPELFALNGGIDSKTKIHIKGCNIGRNLEMLNALDEAFGKSATIDAPTHKQGYEYHTERKGKSCQIVATESFSVYNVEFPGKVDKSPEELVKAFKDKYSMLGFSDQDWEIAVLGTAKYGNKVDKAAAARKKEVDLKLTADLKALDNKASDYKSEAKRLRDVAKSEKDKITAETKAAKNTLVAKGSKGAKKNVVMPFKVPLFNDRLPPTTEPEIIKMAPRWFPKERSKGWKFTGGSVLISREDDRDKYTYSINASKKDDTAVFAYSIETPAFPKNDEDAKALANINMAKYSKTHPDFAVSRANLFEWRITRVNNKGKHTINAFLEMTLYTVDLVLQTKEGHKIDPAEKEGEPFFFGESNID
jgi:hypothetical protein